MKPNVLRSMIGPHKHSPCTVYAKEHYNLYYNVDIQIMTLASPLRQSCTSYGAAMLMLNKCTAYAKHKVDVSSIHSR